MRNNKGMYLRNELWDFMMGTKIDFYLVTRGQIGNLLWARLRNVLYPSRAIRATEIRVMLTNIRKYVTREKD